MHEYNYGKLTCSFSVHGICTSLMPVFFALVQKYAHINIVSSHTLHQIQCAREGQTADANLCSSENSSGLLTMKADIEFK